MANPVFDFGRSEKADLQHSTFDLTKKEFFTGRIGYLYPCYKKEVLAGDKVTLQPYLDIQMSPTLKTLKSKLKCVIDYFFVPFQAVWKDYPYFVNQGQNGVGQVPEIPYHSFNNGSTAVSHGSLFDYLGVPTLASQNTTTLAHLQLKKLHPVGSGHSAKECGFFFGLHQNRAHDWDADVKTSKAERADLYFKHIVEDYSTAPLSGLAGMHTEDSLGVHTTDSSSPYGKISHCVAFGTQILTWSLDNGYALNPDVDGTQYDLSGDNVLTPIRERGNRGFGLIKKPLASSAEFRFKNSFVPVKSDIFNPSFPTADNRKSEVIVMFDYAGRPQRFFVNNSNTDGVDPFTCSREWCNNSLGGDNSGSTIYGAPSKGSFNTTSYHLSEDMINDINAYIATDNGKKGITFGFYTFYDVEEDKITFPAVGIWSLPLVNYYDSNAVAGLGTFNPSSKAMTIPIPQNHASSSACTEVSPQNLSWYLGRICEVPLAVSKVEDIDVLSTKPYAKDAQGNIAIKLNAFYARANECIYNFFYRNRVTDPLLDAQGRRVINQYLRDDYMTSGEDTHNYVLHKALLEKDRFTSCISADIINHTPLVGIRKATDDTNAVQLSFAVNGNPQGAWISEEDGQVKISHYDEGLPNGTLNVIKDTIKQGIALRDLQSVRQLQSWLHKHIECGYNFSEIQLATFGVKSKWNPNTAPMYLGGTAEVIDNGNIVSMAGDNMGERCGNPTAFSTHENTVSYFCPDAGVVMGIFRIIPEVVYTQTIDPLFLKHDYFQFYNASFDNKGYESVTKGQMMPQLAVVEGKVNEVFGYNVPWNDYKFENNEAHADARTTERDMLLYREFAQCPDLSRSFLECDPDDYDHIFRHISSLDDKFYCACMTKAIFSRPIGNPVDTI